MHLPHLGHSHRKVVPGTAAGTFVIDPETPKPTIQLMAYNPDTYEELEIESLDQIQDYLGRFPVTWVNVNGLSDSESFTTFGNMFNLHPLAMEDVVNVPQRPKVEEFQVQLFIVSQMPTLGHEHLKEQLSLFLGKNYVLTFQERPGDCLDPIRARVRKGGPRLRNAGPDYLTHAILDRILDTYFPYLDEYGEQLSALEERLFRNPTKADLHRLHQLKRSLEPLRYILLSYRDVFISLSRDETPFVTETIHFYLRDCYDHTLQLIDLLANYRETCSSLMDLYLSSVSNKMNEVMKVLTITATIFIPLTFIAGIYGMNFDPGASRFNMPELGWYWGYPFALTLMVIVALVMIFFFRSRGWLGGSVGPDDDDADKEE
ncbi:MAG: magnesium/cobalt transporter CorA [Candidatus Eisenbacteria bacterium]|uniref:Magnesium transport protein CorA n=1 Tax=Eiseniibacteriota bacterium TaxID=2212470 RepID=A0A948W555_UNCEI|nr:magnesium/cobalt transporter CorA [Candidatus Eisenbacteria bacterium]